MTCYQEGETVRLVGERGRRYRVERIRLNGEVDVRNARGLKTVTSDRIIAAPADPAPAIPSHGPAKRRGR